MRSVAIAAAAAAEVVEAAAAAVVATVRSEDNGLDADSSVADTELVEDDRSPVPMDSLPPDASSDTLEEVVVAFVAAAVVVVAEPSAVAVGVVLAALQSEAFGIAWIVRASFELASVALGVID